MDDNISPKIALNPIITANNRLKDETVAITEKLQVKFKYMEVAKTIGNIRLVLGGNVFLNKYKNQKSSDMLFNTLEKRISEFLDNLETGVVLNSLKITRLIECFGMFESQMASLSDDKLAAFMSPQNKTELKNEIDDNEIPVNINIYWSMNVNDFNKE